MSALLLQQLEQAITSRNPLLSLRLKPGLAKAEIRDSLAAAEITGTTQPLSDFYSWRNGTLLEENVALKKTAFFPGQNYQFIDLETAIEQSNNMNEAAAFHPMLADFGGRYFPIFWDLATGAVAVELKPSKENAIVLIEFESTEPIRQAYTSFDHFLKDVIRSYQRNLPLRCFSEI